MPQIIAKNFNGGVNLEDFVGDLNDNEVEEAINAVITKKGSLKKREGTSEYGTDANTDKVLALLDYIDSSNAQKKLKAIGEKVVEYNAGLWDTDIKIGLTTGLVLAMDQIKCPAVASTATGTGSSGTDYTLVDTGIAWTENAYRDYVVVITAGTGIGQVKTILENTDDTLYVDGRWDVNPDGTSQYAIKAKVEAVICNNGTDASFKIITETATATPRVPKFTDQVVHNGRLWGIIGSKLYFSAIGNGEQFDGYAEIETGDDGLLGVGRTKDYLVVYSKTKTGVVIGNDPDTMEFKWRANTHGCIGKQSIATWGSLCIALAQEGVYAFDGSRDYLLSRNIKPAITAIKASLKTASSGYVFDDKYYLMHAKNSASTVKDRIWVLDLVWTDIVGQRGVWTPFEGLNANVMGTFKDSNGLLQLYIGESDSSKVLNLYDGTYTDEGSNIAFSVKTKERDEGRVSVFKKLGWLFYEGATQTVASDLQLYKNLDGLGFELIDAISHLQTGGLWDAGLFDVAVFGGSTRKIQRMRTGGRGRTIQYQFYNNIASQPIEIFKIEQDYKWYNLH